MNFAELLASLTAEGVELPDDAFVQLGTAHDSDMVNATAAVNEANAALAVATAEIERLQAHNYRLMMSLDAQQTPNTDSVGDEADTDNGDTDEDDIFEDVN